MSVMSRSVSVSSDAGKHPMIWTVTTAKDSLTNIERFVNRNLAGGADHLVVFVDDDDPDALAFLSDHPHATGVAATTWWGDSRPPALNSRQRIAANVVGAIAARLGDVDWLFHVDCDEVIQVDRGRLYNLDKDINVVRLEVLEAVAEWDPAANHRNLFKRKLAKKELRALHALGALSRARNDHYFHGHVSGKVGMRPGSNLWLGIHRAMDSNREAVSAFEAPWLRMLHFESVSGPEFIRKWRNLLDSGTDATIRSARSAVADAVRVELENGDDDVLARLENVFMETTADDVKTLCRLGYLEVVDLQATLREPIRYRRSEELLNLLRALALEEKRVFEPEREPREVDEILSRLFRSS